MNFNCLTSCQTSEDKTRQTGLLRLVGTSRLTCKQKPNSQTANWHELGRTQKRWKANIAQSAFFLAYKELEHDGTLLL